MASTAGAWRYDTPGAHESVSDIIERHSVNPVGIREAALEGRDLSGVRRVLDLGCGFGFMTEAVALRAAPDATIVGVDAGAANREPFRRRVARTGRRAEFRSLEVGSRLPWEDGSFDLVVSSFSLYFFPQALADIARVLSPSGRLLAVTHSEASVRDQVILMGGNPETSPLMALARRFSAENGEALLRGHFAVVECIDYRNELVFGPDEMGELIEYLTFKTHLLLGGGPGDLLHAGRLCSGLEEALRGRGPVVLAKDDAVFWAGAGRSGANGGSSRRGEE